MGTGPAGVGGRDVGRRAGRPHGGGALWPDHAYGAVSGIVLGVGSIYDDIYVQRYAIPVADFTGAPLTGAAPLTVTFDNRSTPLYGTTGYTWTFGDGSTLLTTGGATSAITGPTHVYTTPGVYTVTLTVEVEDETATLTRTHYVTVTAAGGVMTSTRVISYVYDPLGRLVEADYSTGERYEYAYDAVGNRTVMTTTLGATSVTTYTYDAANRLTKVGDVAYTWDAWGNLTNDGVFTYTYNAAGRMVRAESVTATLVYTYTADGLRVAQSADGAVTTFAWDWATGVPELLSTGSARYLVGHDTLGQWDGAWTYYLPDALGSVRQATDGAGAVVSAREWSPYGVEVGAAQPGLGYTGEWFDDDVGLVYLRARWYSLRDGIFLSRDPIKSEPPYQYVRGNPVNRVDPSGYFVWPHRVGEDYFYSCKCGWIDRTHAGSRKDLIERVRDQYEPGPEWNPSPFEEWGFLEESRVSGGNSPLARGIYGGFMVRKAGLGGQSAYEVALGIMIAWENFFEAAQGHDFYAATQSSFSEEDLVSDLIGFHIGYGEVTGTEPNSFEDFMKLCEVVGYEYYNVDRATFVEIQSTIWTEYMLENGMFRKHYQWGCRPPGRWSGEIAVNVGPRFDSDRVVPPLDPTRGTGCYSFSCGKQQEQLPSELLRVTPQSPGRNWEWNFGVWDVRELRFGVIPYFERRVIWFDTGQLNREPLNWAPTGQ